MSEARPRRPRRPLRKVLVWGGGACLLLALVVVLLGPTIAGAVVPALAGKANLPGRIEVARVKLTWTGTMAVEQATLYDTTGDTIASVSLRTGGGLLGLLDGTLRDDVIIQGWAHVSMDEQGVTNVERALGLERTQQTAAAPSTPASELKLPFTRVILDGLDLAFTRDGTPTVGIAKFQGEAVASGANLHVQAKGSIVALARPATARDEIANAPSQGTLNATARFDLNTLTGNAEADLDNITVDAARALAGLSGSVEAVESAGVTALGGLDLDVSLALQAGAPQQATLRVASRSISANFSMVSREGVMTLTEPARFEADAAAFLANDTLRVLLLPDERVEITQASRLNLTIDHLTIPMQGAAPDVRAASGVLRLWAGRTLMNVPTPEGQPVEVRANELLVTLAKRADAPAVALDALLKAGVRGRPDGTLTLSAQILPPGPEGFELPEPTPGAIIALLPQATLRLDQLPTLAAKPWLSEVESMGLDLAAFVGGMIDASIEWGSGQDDRALLAASINAPHLRASASAAWSEQAIELTTPLILHVARPNEALKPWMPPGWVLTNGRGLTLEAGRATLPMQGLSPRFQDASVRVDAQAMQMQLRVPDQPSVVLPRLHVALQAQDNTAAVQLNASPTIDAIAANLNANIRMQGLQGLLQDQWPVVLGDLELRAPTQMASVLGTVVADRPLEAWLRDALGPQATVKLQLHEPEPGQSLAARLTIDTQHVGLHTTGLSASPQGITLTGAILNATPSDALWQSVATMVNLPGTSLLARAPLRVDIGSATLPFDGTPADLASLLETTSITAALATPWTISGVPIGDADDARTTTVAIKDLRASLNSAGKLLTGDAGARATIDLALDAPEQGPVATLRAEVLSNDRQGYDASIRLDQLNPALAMALAGGTPAAREALDGALGNGGRLELQGTIDRSPSGEYTPRSARIDVQAPRLRSIRPIDIEFASDTIALSGPASLAWQPDAAWLQSAIGARIEMADPFEIALERVQVGNPMAGGVLLAPEHAWLNASFKGTDATIAIEGRPDIRLHSIEATHRRVGPARFAVTAKASAGDAGVVELNGLFSDPTDADGRIDLQDSIFRGTLRGDKVPVALADAMTNSDGLLAELIGDVVDLDAEISEGRLIPGTPPSANVRFSVRGPRAQASAYGRLENHLITMPEPQSILTIREVRPEVSRRFAEIVPELLLVEKRPEDGPAIVRTQGLAIPTNGQWGHANGNITIALGTARFRSSSLLAGVLKATGQREQGALGRRIEPIEIGVTNGLLTYQPFDLPLGDLTLNTEGAVNLNDNTMDVVIWIPMAALSDEAAGRFNTGLGSAIGRAVPGFSAITTVPWRVSGSLDGPSIRPAPNVLIERRGDQLLGPLLRPGETITDLLGIPRRREAPRGGG